MKLTQNFTEVDRENILQVLKYTIQEENENKIWRKTSIKIIGIILAIILILCGTYFYWIDLKNWRVLTLTVGIFVLIWIAGLEMLKKKMDKAILQNVNKYIEPFEVYLEEKVMIYRGKTFDYEMVKAVMNYKDMLYLLVDRVWLIIKVDEIERKGVLNTIQNYSNTYLIDKEEPFNLKEFL